MLKFIKSRLIEGLEYYGAEDASPQSDDFSVGVVESNNSSYRFNDGRLNKDGANILYKDNEPIIDFGVGGLGNLKVNNKTIPNALYLKGGYNASEQGKGYGTEGLKVLFEKLPKIENIVLQCYDTACPFWFKMGGEEIDTKEISTNNMLRTLVVNRHSLN